MRTSKGHCQHKSLQVVQDVCVWEEGCNTWKICSVVLSCLIVTQAFHEHVGFYERSEDDHVQSWKSDSIRFRFVVTIKNTCLWRTDPPAKSHQQTPENIRWPNFFHKHISSCSHVEGTSYHCSRGSKHVRNPLSAGLGEIINKMENDPKHQKDKITYANVHFWTATY